jgi:dTDP-4-amino-4,6-dideoxygalactose transaminase
VPVEGRPVLHLFSGRYALYHGLRLLKIEPGDTVLVPAYHCAVLVDPLVHHGARVRFYRVDRETRPDFDDLEARIAVTARAVVAIHYFGFPQPIAQLRELCAGGASG